MNKIRHLILFFIIALNACTSGHSSSHSSNQSSNHGNNSNCHSDEDCRNHLTYYDFISQTTPPTLQLQQSIESSPLPFITEESDTVSLTPTSDGDETGINENCDLLINQVCITENSDPIVITEPSSGLVISEPPNEPNIHLEYPISTPVPAPEPSSPPPVIIADPTPIDITTDDDNDEPSENLDFSVNFDSIFKAHGFFHIQPEDNNCLDTELCVDGWVKPMGQSHMQCQDGQVLDQCPIYDFAWHPDSGINQAWWEVIENSFTIQRDFITQGQIQLNNTPGANYSWQLSMREIFVSVSDISPIQTIKAIHFNQRPCLELESCFQYDIYDLNDNNIESHTALDFSESLLDIHQMELIDELLLEGKILLMSGRTNISTEDDQLTDRVFIIEQVYIPLVED